MSQPQNPEDPQEDPTSETTSTEAPAPKKPKKAKAPAVEQPEEPVVTFLSPEKRAQEVHQLLGRLNQLYQETLDLRRKALPVARPHNLVIDEQDLVLEWDIKVHGKDATPIRLRGSSTFSEILDPALLQQGMRIVQEGFSNAVTMPFQTRMMRFLSDVTLAAQRAENQAAAVDDDEDEVFRISMTDEDEFPDPDLPAGTLTGEGDEDQ